MVKRKFSPEVLLKASKYIDGLQNHVKELNLVIVNRQSFLKDVEDFLLKRKFMSLKDFKRIQDKYQPTRLK